jgi:hypothetical protein
MAEGFYSEQKTTFIHVFGRSLAAIPMVIIKLWMPILFAVLLKGAAYLAEIWLSRLTISPTIEWSIIGFLVLMQVYLWSVVMVGVDHLLSRFSVFNIGSCFKQVFKRLIPLIMAYLFFVLWVIYMPHFFIGAFHWLLKLFGLKGSWLVIASFVLGSMIVLSGIVSYIFTPVFVLLRKMSFTDAFKESAEIVGPYWPHVVGVYSFCILTALLTRPNTLVIHTLFGYGVGLTLDLIISFVLYPFYLILLLQLLHYIRSHTPVVERKKSPADTKNPPEEGL